MVNKSKKAEAVKRLRARKAEMGLKRINVYVNPEVHKWISEQPNTQARIIELLVEEKL